MVGDAVDHRRRDEEGLLVVVGGFNILPRTEMSRGSHICHMFYRTLWRGKRRVGTLPGVGIPRGGGQVKIRLEDDPSFC